VYTNNDRKTANYSKEGKFPVPCVVERSSVSAEFRKKHSFSKFTFE